MMKDKYATLIKACWVVLICCFIVKLLGGNFFEIVCNNEKLIGFCDLIKFESFGYYLILYITSTISTVLVLLSILKMKPPYNKKKLIIIILVVSIIYIIKPTSSDNILLNCFSFVLDFFLTIGFPIILDKSKWLRAIIGTVLVLLFQVISLITKNVNIIGIDTNIFLYLIFMIDYYIMIILYYLYSIREEKENEGWTIFSRFNRQRKNNCNR